MFHTFSGNSRRPRQVDLSGHNANPFAASTNSWGAATVTQQTVASAQQERQQRQLERERLNSAKRIQKVWRGYKVRSEVANGHRRTWDQLELESSADDRSILVEQMKLLGSFYVSTQSQDRDRLLGLSHRVANVGVSSFLSNPEIQHNLPKLAIISLQALQASLPQCPLDLLELLVGILKQQPQVFSSIAQDHYKYLSRLLSSGARGEVDRQIFLDAITVPLLQNCDPISNHDRLTAAYTHFALQFLSTPNVSQLLNGMFDILASNLDSNKLAITIGDLFTSSGFNLISTEQKLWLLAHFIALRRSQKRNGQDSVSVKALSLQLSSSSAAIVDRIDVEEQNSYNNEDISRTQPTPLPIFVKEQLLSLVDKQSISGLLEKFSLDPQNKSGTMDEDASVLASYALTLLRIFPGRSDELRMWLHLGSVTSNNGLHVPALKFFWLAVMKSTVFSQIKADSKAALSLLRLQNRGASSNIPQADMTQNREWQTILLFLELYAFVLRFTDDEEFLSPNSINPSETVSRNRDSALPLEDVKQLTLFLKNLSFTIYYHSGELSDDQPQSMTGGLGSYFGTNTTTRFASSEAAVRSTSIPKAPFAGIAGMTFEYVRSVASGVMKMLYERDSRRRFLPKDHWLMTSRFEMEGFIPAVVMEEERRHEIPDDEDEGDDAEEDDFYRSDYGRDVLVGMGRPRRAQQIEAMRRTQQQAARQKMLATIGPRLEVLQNMPFVIPFETRVQIFRQFVFLDQTRRRGGNVDPDIWRMVTMQQAQMQGSRRSAHDALSKHHAKIRRDQIFEDAFQQFYDLGEGLKEPIQITFVDKFDTVEAGIDGGGVTKEFLTSVTKEAFQTGENSLFVTNDQNLLHPNPSALDERRVLLKEAGFTESDPEWRETIRDLLNHYEFLGRVVGKCLYEGILVDIAFASFFLLKWAASSTTGETSYKANINDLRDLDESLYQGLLQVKNYPGNVEDFSLDFTITDTVSLANTPTKAITRNLMPNGSSIAVTNENRPLYVSYVARHRLQNQPHLQTQSFLRGLGSIIKPSWLSMFNQSELQTLIGGDSSEIDVADLRANTQYGGVYVIGDDGLEHDTVQLFWEVMRELDDTDRRKVLKYVTSTPRAPLLGFAQLNPRFSIRDAGSDEARLPSTSTCVNLLKLPRYSSKGVLRDKLLYAVNSGAGFDLS